MVREDSPSIAKDVSFGEELPDPVKEVLSILIVEKDLSPFYPPDDDMVHNTRGI